MLILTNDMILEDIRGFEKRIQGAKGQLSKLQETAETWETRKKLKEKRKILTDEIKHVRNLIGIGADALST